MSRGLVRRASIGLALLTGAALVTACLRVLPPPVDDGPPPGSVWTNVPAGMTVGEALSQQTEADKDAKSAGCITCHTGIEEMHPSGIVKLGCTDCHGGDATATQKQFAHILPDGMALAEHPELSNSSVVPESEHVSWLRHSYEYVRFVNPGDLRVAMETCGICHEAETYNSKKSMMATSAMLWGTVLYNNGSFPLKRPRFGEAYDSRGRGVRVQTVPPPTDHDVKYKGVLAYLDPLPRYNIAQMGNILRTFERGGSRPLELANPDRLEEAGLPLRRLSQRGLGTLLRTDPVYLGIIKTRLLDPTMWQPGTNDHPGDYRHSGCTACHVVYANDRDPSHSGPYASAGNRGYSHSADPTIPKEESGHPIKHEMTRAIPNSQCMVCHIHPGTNMLMTYYGDLWYDNETDGHLLYYQDGREPTTERIFEVSERNPEGAAVRGKWSEYEFLAEISTMNPDLPNVQFSDYHGHGWLFRKVWKKDRKGNLVDKAGNIIDPKDPNKFDKAVHLKDHHLEAGMHCVDCHFTQDVHGDGKLYGEPRAATEIMCADCHGTVNAKATLVSSGNAGPNDMSNSRTPFGKRWRWVGGVLYQRSQLDRDVEWAVPQVIDSIDPGMSGAKYFEGEGEKERPVYNEKARYAKTIQKDGSTWGSVPDDPHDLAHSDERMTCQACHTSWTTACFGCHLPMMANQRRELRHYEGGTSRNWTQYNYQVLRDAAYMLGIDGTVTGNRISPVRSACAIVVGSSNQNREWLYSQQQTISAEGYSGQAFSTYVPHTVRGEETKTCTECHVSEENDNNAWMAQLLLQGTNYTNFMGRFCYVGAGKDGFYGVVVTERDEPQAVYGSTLHRDAFPNRYENFVENKNRILTEAYHHGGTDTRSIQHRGEYLYASEGEGGTWLYDISNIDNKGFSERITTSIFSPLGQRFYVKHPFSASLASPTTLGVDPTRPRNPANEEQPIHAMFAFLYVADPHLGLAMPIGATLLDGNPANNFVEADVVFNPDGLLDGAMYVHVAGPWCFVGCDKGLVILDLQPMTLADPTPRVAKIIPKEQISGVTGVGMQFRYAFVTDAEGFKVIDMTDGYDAKLLPSATIKIKEAKDVYVARTYAFVSAGSEGLKIIDVEKPHKPFVDQTFTADGALNDTRQTKVAMTNASLFAYVADGVNGLRVLQLTSPESVPGFAGFSPRLAPQLIATFKTNHPAVCVTKPLDRDRAVDEGGNQLAVFGRIGARPFNKEEQQRMYLRDGKLYTVTDTPKTQPISNVRRDEQK